MRTRWFVVASLVVAGCMPTREGDQPDLSGQDVRLTILHTSDIHSRLLPYDLAPIKTDIDLGLLPEAPPYGGVTRMAALIARERSRSDRVIHLDSGDQFEGAPIFNLSSGEPEIKWMSQVRPDAVVIGNHEFDRGARNFAEQYQRWGTYPLLAANYVFSNTSDPISNQLGAISRPYVILNVKGLKVGVIGMGNLSSLNSIVEGGNTLQITPIEQNEAARQWVEFLKPQVDLIAIVSHLGLTEDQQLVTGYEAYFPGRTNIDEFLKRPVDPWIQVEPTYPDGTRHVFIPGVRDIDVIMGGHLHIVLNPSQELVNPNQPDRRVVLQHSGAFAKYVGRLDLVVHMPAKDASADRKALGAEVVAHTYHPFPVDAIWCDDDARAKRGAMSTDDYLKYLVDKKAACTQQEDRLTTWLLQPYILDQTVKLELPRIFAFAPQNIDRRNSASGGDSPLGNLTAESMKIRRRVEAEFALTNTLGIRDNLYAGPITLEDMFNVFPFENTINIMYVSGREMHELFDFSAAKSADRGCQSQAQVAGGRFTMDCAQALVNEQGLPCKVDADCQKNYPRADNDIRSPWTCNHEFGGDIGICTAEESYAITINGAPVNPDASYKIAVNDYIAKGGSGFKVLQRNTTRIETGISLRDSLIDYLRGQCTCQDINAGRATSSVGLPCATIIHYNADGTPAVKSDGSPDREVDPVAIGYCQTAATYEGWLGNTYKADDQNSADALRTGTCSCSDVLKNVPDGGGEPAPLPDGGVDPCADPSTLPQMARLCSAPSLTAGKCNCLDVLIHNEFKCGHITPELEAFCSKPTQMPIVTGIEDGRIGRRVK